MTANDQIAELNRQRSERHRLIDEEYDARVRMVPHVCEREEDVIDIDARTIYEMNHCKHCGAEMPAQST